MQRYEVRLSKSASAEIDAIEDYISSEFSYYDAERVVARIYRMIQSLNLFPERKKVSDDPEMWMVHIKKYIILYTIDKKKRLVFIRNVLAAKQDYTRFLT